MTDYDERSVTGTLPQLVDTGSVARTVFDAVAGFGPLQKYLDDPTVEEIWIKDPLTAMSGRCRGSICRCRRPRLRGSRQVVTGAPGLWRCFPGRVAGVLAFGLVLAACSGSAPGVDASSGPSATTSASATTTATASAAVDALLRERGFTGAVLVRRGGEVLVRRGYGQADGALGSANTPSTRFRIGSVTKQFTAAAVLVLAARGKVGLEDRACRYLPRCPGAWSTISVRHLLTHQSGLPEFLDLPGFDAMRPSTPADTLADLRRVPLDFAPGTSFSYSNSGYIALGLVIEQASGVDYETFLRDSFFAPLGMSDSGYEHSGDVATVGYRDPDHVADPLDMSVPFAAGGLFSTVDDLARWDTTLAGDDILPQDQIAQLWKPEVTNTDVVGFAYGFGEYVGRVDGGRLVIHDGGINGFRSVLARWPDEGHLVVLLSNHEDTPDLRALAQDVAAVE